MRAGASDLQRIGTGMRVRGRAGIADVVALVLALEERQSMLPSERRARDRALATELEGSEGVLRLRRWVALAATPALALRVRRVTRAFAWIRIGFTLVGGLLGWSTASALLSIRGSEGRISIAACLAFLVVLPLLGWLASVVVWLGAGWRPTAGGLGERAPVARAVHRLVLRLLPAPVRLDVEAVFGRARAHAALFARLQRGQWTSWLLQAGVSFGLGALAATLVFVVFTDLAFGWSTTLDVAPERVHRVVAAIAWPWARLWPEASPSLELLEATRHFRVAAAAAGQAGRPSPLVYGAWWPFLVMAIGCYAVLPRLATLPVLGLWLGRESERALRLMPGALELMESLSAPWVESGGEGEAGPVGRALGGMVPEVELAGFLARSRALDSAAPFAVVWAEAVGESALGASLGDASRVLSAGGRRSLEEDAEAVRAAAEAGGAMLVVVRGHEPPVLEQLDFLAALRRAAGAERSLAVVLVGGSARDLEIWRGKLVELADPTLAVARLERTAAQGAA